MIGQCMEEWLLELIDCMCADMWWWRQHVRCWSADVSRNILRWENREREKVDVHGSTCTGRREILTSCKSIALSQTQSYRHICESSSKKKQKKQAWMTNEAALQFTPISNQQQWMKHSMIGQWQQVASDIIISCNISEFAFCITHHRIHLAFTYKGCGWGKKEDEKRAR